MPSSPVLPPLRESFDYPTISLYGLQYSTRESVLPSALSSDEEVQSGPSLGAKWVTDYAHQVTSDAEAHTEDCRCLICCTCPGCNYDSDGYSVTSIGYGDTETPSEHLLPEQSGVGRGELNSHELSQCDSMSGNSETLPTSFHANPAAAVNKSLGVTAANIPTTPLGPPNSTPYSPPSAVYYHFTPPEPSFVDMLPPPPPHLSAYGLKLAAALEAQGDTSSQRGRKKRKLDGTPVPPNRSTPQLGHSSGVSQNINGSEKNGRKAQAEFVSRTLDSAIRVAGEDKREEPSQPPAPAQQPTTQPSSGQTGPPPAIEDLEDTEMPDVSGQSGDDSEEEVPGESLWLKQLKDLYDKRPNKEMQAALLNVLEKLSLEVEEEGRGKPRNQRKKRGNSPWNQDEDYLCTDGPRRRERMRVLLSGYIRLVLGQLLNLKDNKTPLPRGPPPEVAAPTANAFYVKWNESEKSEFNQIAARIIARRVVSDHPKLGRLDFVQQMATGHLKHLRARYRRQTEAAYIAKEPERLRSSSAGTRKRTLYNHRIRIINAIPALARHGRLIESLGLEGTSSDEEDITRQGTYVIKRRKQLSSKVNHLKRQLDLAYSIHFKGPGSKGNQLRKRIDTGKVSNRRLKITGLPTSCMDPTWFSTLTEVQKDLYEFRDMQYDFSFPEELLRAPEEV